MRFSRLVFWCLRKGVAGWRFGLGWGGRVRIFIFRGSVVWSLVACTFLFVVSFCLLFCFFVYRGLVFYELVVSRVK